MHFLFIFLLPLICLGFTQKDEILSRQSPILPKSRAPDERPLKWISHAKSYRVWRDDKEGIVFDTTVHFNKHGFRTTGIEHKSTKHLFFVGCSVTFGLGLQDEETFPFLISQKLSDWNIQNMGYRGAGAHDQLYIWRAFHFPELFKDEEGLMIFTMISDHIERYARTWRYLAWAFPHSTIYELEEGKFVYKDIIKEKWDYKFTRWTKKKWPMLYWWLRLTHYHSDYLASQAREEFPDLLDELKRTYLKQYPQGRFVVSWMDSPIPQDPEKAQEFKNALTKKGIEYWDPSEKLRQESGVKSWIIPRDGHPSAEANKFYSNFLIRQMEERKL